jgi:RPA family protein
MFEDFERLATPTVERLIAKLREFIATNKELNATDLKNLTEQINKLEEGLIKRNPFEGLTKGIERVRQARQKLSASSFKDEKEYTDALDEQEAGYDDIEQALKGIQLYKTIGQSIRCAAKKVSPGDTFLDRIQELSN